MTLSRRIAIAMSRLPRQIDPKAAWLGGLRAALRRVHQEGATLLIVEGTAGSDVVRRGAERLGIAIDKLEVPDEASTVDQHESVLPHRDRILLEAADCVIALDVRTNGNIHRALRLALQQHRQVVFVDLPGLQSRAVRDELLSFGARLWQPEPSEQLSFNNPAICHSTGIDPVCEVAAIPSSTDWMYLTHTTRVCAGPWHGQSSDDYLDALLDDSADADHSALACLERIVNQRRLIASSQMIRGGYPMVCFTAVPLNELPAIRQFRNHRTRWDFEPYGICIRRSWLQERETRAVIYGDDAVWQELADVDRPYFQFTSQSGIDWTIEREWRHQGDLELRELTADDVLLFVPRHADVIRLTPWSPWPITLWPQPEAVDNS